MDKMREEFEDWFSKNQPKYAGVSYHGSKAVCWQAWQASRAALVVKIPEEHDSGDGTIGVLQDDFAKSLEDAGVSYE